LEEDEDFSSDEEESLDVRKKLKEETEVYILSGNTNKQHTNTEN